MFTVVAPGDFEGWNRVVSPPKRGWVSLQPEREVILDKRRRTASIAASDSGKYPYTSFKIVSRCNKPAGKLIPLAYKGNAVLGESDPYKVDCAAWRKPVAVLDAVLVDAPMTVVVNVLAAPVVTCGGLYFLLFGGEMW